MLKRSRSLFGLTGLCVALMGTAAIARAQVATPPARTAPSHKLHANALAAATTGSVPPGWTCFGGCGSDAADGVVPLSPTGNKTYEWVSTTGGATGVGMLPSGSLGSETNGSTLATPIFSATAGTPLNFYFNYVTSDGAGYADYAWAELYDSTNKPVALLFTARTEPTGSIIPGTGLPPPMATLTPASVPIIGGAPAWSPLGSWTGDCYASGCGYTGWTQANYVIPTTGNYYLKIGAVNWLDQLYDSGLAVDGVTIGGTPIALLSGSLDVEYGTDAHMAWLGLASATDSKGVPITVQNAAQQLGYDHFNWLQIITSDLQLQACAANKTLAGCSSDFTSSGSVPAIPTVDPPLGGYAYELCPSAETATDQCRSTFPAQDYWPMYWDEYFAPVGSYYYPNPSKPEYFQDFRSGYLLTDMGAVGQSPSMALGYSLSDMPGTSFSVPGSPGTPESIAFVDALVGVKGSCNQLISSNCSFQIIPGTTFKWTASNGTVSPVLTPGGPGTSAHLATPGGSMHTAKQADRNPASPTDLTGQELSQSIITINQFLSLANLNSSTLAAIGGSIGSVTANLVPSEAVALTAYQAGAALIAPSQVKTTASGLAYSRVTQSFSGTITVENISSSTITGQIEVVLLGVPNSVTLTNSTGLVAGVPYLTVPGLGLTPGKSVTVNIQLKNPLNATMNLAPVVYTGVFQ